SVVFKGSKYVAQYVSSLWWTKHTSSANSTRTRINIEITPKLFVTGFRILEGAEMLFDVSLGTKQSLLFTAPQCNAYGAPWFRTECFKNARRLHHDRAAYGIVSCPGC